MICAGPRPWWSGRCGVCRRNAKAKGRSRLCETLSPYLATERSDVKLSGLLGISEAGVKRQLHNLRRCYRWLIWAEVAETVEDPGGGKKRDPPLVRHAHATGGLKQAGWTLNRNMAKHMRSQKHFRHTGCENFSLMQLLHTCTAPSET